MGENYKLVSCPVCGRTFPQVKELVSHIKTHNRIDSEYNKSVVAEEEKEKNSYFG
jgi:4-hydroxy-3-methylbut-2-en-1-yl diphosphate synthase IspG/GcpE